MTYVAEAKADPVTSIMQTRGTALRAAALVASIAGLLLPSITGTAMGITQSSNLLQFAGWSVLSPVALAAALAIPAVAPAFSRLMDIIAVVLTVLVLGYAAYVFFDAMNQVSQAAGMMSGMMGSDPYSQSVASSMTRSFGVSVSPGLGLFAMAGSAALIAIQCARTARGS